MLNRIKCWLKGHNWKYDKCDHYCGSVFFKGRTRMFLKTITYKCYICNCIKEHEVTYTKEQELLTNQRSSRIKNILNNL